ncbi:alpha/beta fold hydrolase [Paraburkholderia youngii]|uniref:alpha/beta fold hydrolase n=1 Tax=Paraburkholderia youngii TaxID=2782701 RepID=UPI003D23644B
MGNSFGCQILTELAARHPGDVKALVLQGRLETTRPWTSITGGRAANPFVAVASVGLAVRANIL